MLLATGCRDSTPPATPAGPGGTVVSGQYHGELLNYAIDNLNRLEEFDSADALQQIFQNLNPQNRNRQTVSDPLLAVWPEPEMLRQIVDRLNQWIRTRQPPADWHRDAMLSTLPAPLAELPQLKDLGRMEFSLFDGYVLQEAVWLRDIGHWASGESAEDLQRAASLFDWTIRNIQVEADKAGRIPQFPWETLLFGRGAAVERGWVFILLARQLGIDAAMLYVSEGKGVETKAEGGGRKAEEKSPNLQVSKSPNDSLRPWCVAVLIEGHAYLFDPLLGLPIPAPKGITLGQSGQLAIQPATLAQVVADDKLLRQLDADDAHRYGVTASDLKRVVVMLEASPSYLSRRMKLLESYLTGPQKMVLATSPTGQAKYWKAVGHVADVQLWQWPFETLQRRMHLNIKQVDARLALLLPFYGMPSAPLRRGRILHLKGELLGDRGAIHYYQLARPSNAELSASSAHPVEKLIYLRGKQDASYWLGLIAYQRKNYPAAVDYFTRRTLEFTPGGPWTDGAHYNLGRTFEAAGEMQKAILQYRGNAHSPGYLGDLLRAKWLGKKR